MSRRKRPAKPADSGVEASPEILTLRPDGASGSGRAYARAIPARAGGRDRARGPRSQAAAARVDAKAVTPARACVFAGVRRVFEHAAWADRARRSEAERLGLSARDRALATQLAYGTVQRRVTPD